MGKLITHTCPECGATPLPKIAWTMTIADVASQVWDARSYQELVKQWAHITLRGSWRSI